MQMEKRLVIRDLCGEPTVINAGSLADCKARSSVPRSEALIGAERLTKVGARAVSRDGG
jgi:hypothetical protein